MLGGCRTLFVQQEKQLKCGDLQVLQQREVAGLTLLDAFHLKGWSDAPCSLGFRGPPSQRTGYGLGFMSQFSLALARLVRFHQDRRPDVFVEDSIAWRILSLISSGLVASVVASIMDLCHMASPRLLLLKLGAA